MARIGDATRAPLVLDSTASLAVARGHAVEAVRLAAAAAHLRTTIGGSVPTFIVDVGAAIATARAELGEAAFSSAWADGEGLDIDAALGTALGALTTSGSEPAAARGGAGSAA